MNGYQIDTHLCQKDTPEPEPIQMMGLIYRKPYVYLGLLCAFLSLGRTAGDVTPTASSDRSSVAVSLGGPKVATCSQCPIYRRFTSMTIEVEGLATSELGGVIVALEPLWQHQDAPNSSASEMLRSRLHPNGFERGRAVIPLESAEGPMAVGPYCATVYQWQQGGFQRIAEEPFFVIFNAFDQVDRTSHHWRASDYLSNQMHIAQKSEDGEVRLYDWQLDIDREQVFLLAIEAVAGSRHPATAVEQAASVTADKIEGHWPNLGVMGGRVANSSERDDSWKPASIRSISQRLRRRARRGQCFDYAAFSVALLRSVGLVSTATTVIDPDNIEHPQTSNQQVSWRFHVWTEVFMEGHWKALD
ncbi:MAG: transglutaminase domain-containing protein, partial [bacterium]